LQASAADFAFVTSCDAPFLNLELVRFLTSRITDWDVVVPYWEERFQPLHAVYRTKVASLLAQQLERDELRPITLYERVRTLKISGEEIRRFDPAGLSFMNMNTPEDYQAALELWNTTGNGEIGRQGKGETRGEGIASCTVELFGLARLLTKAREITLHLAQPARLADVYHALGEKYPVLLGRVIDGDARSLTRGYACNINGLDFARDNDVSVNPGDRIFIISADAGG
jgi:hypothetical protein